MLKDLLRHRLEGSERSIEALREQLDEIARIAEATIACLARGGTVYTCGNGGSAAEAMHLAEELIGRYRGGDRPAQRAVCLNSDPTALTCIANDFGFETIFRRQCEVLLREGDALVAFSTSGESRNVVEALRTGRSRGATTIGLLGRSGGACRPLCDHVLVAAGEDSAHVQEAHLVVVHLICEAIESAWTGGALRGPASEPLMND